LSGFVWLDAEPDTNNVLFAIPVWALILAKLCSIPIRITIERIDIAAVTAKFSLFLLQKCPM
jgi:hypothetical protein